MYVYIQTERNPALWTVGFYKPDGDFYASSDHSDEKEAAKTVAYINSCKMVSYDPDKGE